MPEPSTLCSKIASCASPRDISSHVLSPLAEALRATGSVFSRFSTTAGASIPDQIENIGAAAPAARSYAIQGHLLDPFIHLGEFSARRWPGPLTINGASDKPRIEAYHDRFISLHALGPLMRIQFVFDINAIRTVAFLGFQRKEGVAPFDARDEALLDDVAPVVRAALKNLLLEEQLARLQAAIDTVGGHLAHDIRILFQDTATSILSSPVQGTTTETSATRGMKFDALGNHGARVQLVNPNASGILGTSGWTDVLTPRELEVVLLLKRGLPTKALAGELNISARTIENHLRAIYQKAGVSGRVALLAALMNASLRP